MSAPGRALAVGISFWLALPALAVTPSESELSAGDVFAVYLDDVLFGSEGSDVIEMQFRALTEFGEPVRQLREDDIRALQDGAPLQKGFEFERFEFADRGVAVVIVLDLRPAMQSPLDASRRALLDFADGLGERDRLAVVGLDSEVRVFAPFASNRTLARDMLAALEVTAESTSPPLFDAVARAADLLRESADLPRRSILIVFSDGAGAEGSRTRIDAIIESSRARDGGGRILIYGIGARQASASGLDALRELATRSGGDYMEDLTRSYRDIWDQTQWSHIARFESKMDGRRHEITLKINDRAASQSVSFPGPSPLYGLPMAVAAASLLLVALVVGSLRRGSSRWLTIETESNRSRRQRLRRGKTEIGRSAQNDVVLESINVSARHAELTIEGGRARLRDRGSTNGTFVNGVEVKTSCTLELGDEIRLGDVEMVFGR